MLDLILLQECRWLRDGLMVNASKEDDLLCDDVNEEDKWLKLAQVCVDDLEHWPDPGLVLPIITALFCRPQPCLDRVQEKNDPDRDGLENYLCAQLFLNVRHRPE